MKLVTNKAKILSQQRQLGYLYQNKKINLANHTSIIFYLSINQLSSKNTNMKGIPVQLEGVINFINTTIQNKTLSQTYQCYLLNLEKATLDTLKLANIAFENLDSHIPFDVRMMFQKTTNKIKEFTKNKPKGQLQKQQKYHNEYDEVQDFLENRPQIERSNSEERGQLYKFLSEVEEKQKQNKLLLQNIPRFSYGVSRNYTQQQKTYFGDINKSSEATSNQTRMTQFFQIGNRNQEYLGVRKLQFNNIQKRKSVNEMVQTDLTLGLLNQMMANINGAKITGFLQQILSQQNMLQKVNESELQNAILNSSNQKDNQVSLQENKKLNINSKRESINAQNTAQKQIQQDNIQAQTKIKEELAHIQGLQLQKVEVNNQQVLVKGFINKKKEAKVKKNDNSRRDSVFNKKNKNMQENETTNTKKKNIQRDSSDKSEKMQHKIKKTINKENILGNRNSKNFPKTHQVDAIQYITLQKSTQTQNPYETQGKKPDSTPIIKSNKEIVSSTKIGRQKKVSLKKQNVLGEIDKQNQRKSSQDQKTAKQSTRQYPSKNSKLANQVNENINKKEDYLTKNKITQNINQQQANEISKNHAHDPVNEAKEQPESVLLQIESTYNSNKCQTFANSTSNFSSLNFKQNLEPKQLKKTKSNFSHFHQSLHSDLSEYKLQKYNHQSNNPSLHKKDLRRSLENLPAIRQEHQNQVYKKREKILSKDKAELLEKENKRLLDQIQEGTSQKKGRNVEWIKVIKDIREYQHLHYKYCGENCVHLNKFYEFLKKKNLSMYINRKQLYVHKQNIEIKPALV